MPSMRSSYLEAAGNFLSVRTKSGDSAYLVSHTCRMVSYNEDPVKYEQVLKAKLTSPNIRMTLMFAALLQMLHEMLKYAIVDQLRDFYIIDFDDASTRRETEVYRQRVLNRVPGDKFKSSLSWLVEMKAITIAQADRLDAIYAHRHDVTHELMKHIVDPEHDIDIDLFTDAMQILKAVKRHWIEAEAGLGTFGDADLDEVVPLDLLTMQWCIDAAMDAAMEEFQVRDGME